MFACLLFALSCRYELLVERPSPEHASQVGCVLFKASERGQLDVLAIKFGTVLLVCLVVCVMSLVLLPSVQSPSDMQWV